MKAFRVHVYGRPEVLTFEDVPLPEPGPGEVVVRHTAIGVNYIDVYHRSGLYPMPLPGGIGVEASGKVDFVGPDVRDLKVGDRVAYAGGIPGAYSEARTVAADRLVKLPPEIDDLTAAAIMLKGMTAEYLVRRTFPIRQGHNVLWHSAAGGVGLIGCQWAKHLGARVIGTVSTPEKSKLARANGCDEVVVTSEQDFVEPVREFSERGVDVVYDSVGKDTFERSLDCLRPLGLLVCFGQSSGPVPPFDVQMLSQKGSLFLTRPTLHTYTARRADLVASANALFDVVKKGIVKVRFEAYPLKDAAQVHRDLEERRTSGSLVLIP